MKAPFLTFIASLGTVSSLFCSEISPPIIIDPLPPSIGLTLSVSTSAYKVTPIFLFGAVGNTKVNSSNVFESGPFPIIPVPPYPFFGRNFTAAVALINHTNEPITFSFPTTATGGNAFDFQVFDSNGNLVWDSNAEGTLRIISTTGVTANTATGVTATTATLGAHQAWRAVELIPLFINGAPVPAGNYTLKVTLVGTPEFESTMSFVVNPVIALD